jgi:hypothetical protein
MGISRFAKLYYLDILLKIVEDKWRYFEIHKIIHR